MEEGMKEPDTEGVAPHGGPESCVGVREGDGEALTGERAGRAIEPRNQGDRGADAVASCGRQHRWRRYARAASGPRAVEEPVEARNPHVPKRGGRGPGVGVEGGKDTCGAAGAAAPDGAPRGRRTCACTEPPCTRTGRS